MFGWVSREEAALCELNVPPEGNDYSRVLLRSSRPEGVNGFVRRALEKADPAKWILAMDIDDTILTSDDRYTTQCQARDIPPIVEVYNVAMARGIPVVFITAREESTGNRKWTEEQLQCVLKRKSTHALLYMRPRSTETWPGISKFKQNSRQDAMRRLNRRVLFMIGDAWTDGLVVNQEQLSKLDKKSGANNKYLLFSPSESQAQFVYKLPEKK